MFGADVFNFEMQMKSVQHLKGTGKRTWDNLKTNS